MATDFETTVEGIFDYAFRLEQSSGNMLNTGQAGTSNWIPVSSPGTYQETGPTISPLGFLFDETGDIRNNADDWADGDTEGTFIVVFKMDDTDSDDRCLLYFGAFGSGDDGCRIHIQDSTGYLVIRMATTSSNYYEGVVETALNDGAFHTVIIRQKGDGTGFEVWIDGNSATVVDDVNGTADTDYWFGDMTPGDYDTSMLGSRTNVGFDRYNDIIAFAGYHTAAISDANVDAIHAAGGLGALPLKRRPGRRLIADFSE